MIIFPMSSKSGYNRWSRRAVIDRVKYGGIHVRHCGGCIVVQYTVDSSLYDDLGNT
jgi:hypothetical protein